MSGFTERDVPDQSGRTVFITGANAGLGFHVARVLAGKHARVLIGCRSEERARKAMRRIKAEFPIAELEFIELDQASLNSVRAAAERVCEEPRLDLLINNAGIMGVPLTRTDDGFEAQLGVNYLAPFALTGLLLNKLEESRGARVVTTASIAHRRATIDFDDLDAEDHYDPWKRYAQSKLADLMFAYELDRRLAAAGRRTISVAAHPGMAETELMRNMPDLVQKIAPVVTAVFNSAAQGAWPTLMAATERHVTGGDYYGPNQLFETRGKAVRVGSTKASKDNEAARRLWDVSVRMTGVDPGLAGI
ncbi:oxidoreductase [Novosphingopyxis sp.]|uniref:oxidoreductase n=1 Tax=Novosphingopyxis sp. TaxID=2709690 RepID=UPI003B5A2DAC